MSAEWNAVSGMINTLGQQDVQRRQKAYYDEQRQDAQLKRQEEAELKQAYDQLSQAYHQSGGDLDAVGSMVKTGPAMQAFSKFVADVANTEEGRQRSMESSAKHADRLYMELSGGVNKALAHQPGSDEWVNIVQNLSPYSGTGFRLGNFDPQTQTFGMMQADPAQGWQESGRMSAQEVQAMMQNFQKGVMSGDGKMAKEMAKAAIRYDINRRKWNSEVISDPSKHILLSDGKKTLAAIPLLHEAPGGGYVYMIQDDQRGLTLAGDLEDYLRKGYKITTQDQMNKETDFSLRRQGHALTAQSHALRAKEGQSVDGSGKPLSPSEINSVQTQLRSGVDLILNAYGGDSIDTSGMDWMDSIRAREIVALPALRKQAAAGDVQAKADLEDYTYLRNSYLTLAREQANAARRSMGVPIETPVGGMNPQNRPDVMAEQGRPYPVRKDDGSVEWRQRTPKGEVVLMPNN